MDDSSRIGRDLPKTSTLSIVSRSPSTSSPSSIFCFVPSKSFRAVATTGAFVVCNTRLASAKPMPREAGVISDQGLIVSYAHESRDVVSTDGIYMLIGSQRIILFVRSTIRRDAYILQCDSSRTQACMTTYGGYRLN
ncbi:unnamed protein product [Periconia digitata]|uniref:Uncharacterized protein n=1 Tax=Periconia digitata TaxID=1303443 RepID=A0A9W4U5A4_9PLEO|nr:unnamed protein product [Periconia digitata]